MNWIEAVILGIVQGLTEFLPVSSSGHIVLGEALLNTESSDNLAFTVVVHFATVISTIVIYRQSIQSIFRDLLKFEWNSATRFALYVLLSMIPVAVAGLFFKDEVEEMFAGKVMLVGLMLLITGGLLLSTRLSRVHNEELTSWKALLIGVAQALAVVPGISRSGATISTALLMKVDRAKAAEFSFLMVIPPILGIMLLDGIEMTEKAQAGTLTIEFSTLLAGFLAAFITGLLACRVMIKIVKSGKIQYFAYYCFLVGIIAIVTSWMG